MSGKYTEGMERGKLEGKAEGKAEGEARGKQLTTKILKLYHQGFSNLAIATQLAVALELVVKTIADYEAA